METKGLLKSWMLACALVLAAGGVLSGCGDDGDPCGTVCQCVEREYGGGGADCYNECQQVVDSTAPGDRQDVCEAELELEGLYACVDSCRAFGGGGGCSCSSSACDYCWCGDEFQNNCPESFRGTGDGCDCGCQWSDPDC